MPKSALTRSFLKRYVPLFALNALIILSIIGASQYILIKYYDQDKMALVRNEFTEMQTLYGRQALSMAQTLAQNPEIIRAFQMAPSAEQRAVFTRQAGDIYETLRAEYKRPLINFHGQDQVLYRLSKRDMFGDSLPRRPHLFHALRTGEPGASLEILKLGFAMNGLAPVIAPTATGNAVFGVVQVSLPFSELYKKIRNNIPGSQIAVLVETKRTAAQVEKTEGKQLGRMTLAHASTPALESYVSGHAETLSDGYTGYTRLEGQLYRIFVQKIPGFQGNSVGLLVFGYNVDDVVRYTMIAVGASLAFVILSFLVIGWVLERFVERKIIDPVTGLAVRVRDISMGKQLEQAIHETESNEIGTIQAAAERLRKTLLNMLKHIQK